MVYAGCSTYRNGKGSERMKEEIPRTKDELKKFYYENMICKDGESEEDIIKKFKRKELVQMFKAIYGSDPMSYETKDVIVSKIKYYYESLERAMRI